MAGLKKSMKVKKAGKPSKASKVEKKAAAPAPVAAAQSDDDAEISDDDSDDDAAAASKAVAVALTPAAAAATRAKLESGKIAVPECDAKAAAQVQDGSGSDSGDEDEEEDLSQVHAALSKSTKASDGAKVLEQQRVQKRANLRERLEAKAEAIAGEKKKKAEERNKKQVSKALTLAERRRRGVVYVGHLPPGFAEPQMKRFFSEFGQVTRLRVSRSLRTGRTKGYGFVEFGGPGDSGRAVAQIVANAMNRFMLYGRTLVVRFMDPLKDYEASGGALDAVHPALFKNCFKKIRPTERINLKKAKTEHNALKLEAGMEAANEAAQGSVGSVVVTARELKRGAKKLAKREEAARSGGVGSGLDGLKLELPAGYCFSSSGSGRKASKAARASVAAGKRIEVVEVTGSAEAEAKKEAAPAPAATTKAVTKASSGSSSGKKKKLVKKGGLKKKKASA